MKKVLVGLTIIILFGCNKNEIYINNSNTTPPVIITTPVVVAPPVVVTLPQSVFKQNSLIADYRLDNNLLDYSQYKNATGFTNRTVSFANDRFGNRLSAMKSGNGYVTISNTFFKFNRSETFSISIWFFDNGNTSGRLISTENPEGNFRITPNSGYNVGLCFGDYQTINVSLNQWHHLVYTYNNRQENLYIDTKLVSSNFDYSTETINHNSQFTIGAKASALHDMWNGGIDDIKIFNYALNQNEVNYLYNN